MTSLLELRENIKSIYYKYEMYITPALRFLMALVIFFGINSKIGYMPLLSNFFIVIVLSLGCAFLPIIALVLATTFVSLAHMYAASMEVALVGLCVYLVMYLLYFRLGNKDLNWVLITMMLFFLGVPYLAPIAVGLLCGPIAILPMTFGVLAYYLIHTVGACVEAVTAEGGASSDLLQMTARALFSNRAMILIIVVFALAAVIVYVTRRMAIENAWKTAAIVGGLFQLVLVLGGSLILKVGISIIGLFIGTIFAVAGGFVIEFFRLLLDYKRTEKVQYEDDEYYYYVTAVPKVTAEATEQSGSRSRRVPAKRRPQSSGGTAKKATSQGRRRPANATRPGSARPTGSARPAGANVPQTRRTPGNYEPRVTERSYERSQVTSEDEL